MIFNKFILRGFFLIKKLEKFDYIYLVFYVFIKCNLVAFVKLDIWKIDILKII